MRSEQVADSRVVDDRAGQRSSHRGWRWGNEPATGARVGRRWFR